MAATIVDPRTIVDHDLIVRRLLHEFCERVDGFLAGTQVVDARELEATGVQIARYIGAVQAMREGKA